MEVVNYPPRKTLLELLAKQISGSGGPDDLQMDLRIAAALFGASDRYALGMLTAPMRLFNRGEPLALMPILHSLIFNARRRGAEFLR